MATNFDSQVYLDSTADAWYDYFVEDALSSHPEAEMDVDSPDCGYDTSHMVILDELSKAIPCYSSQVAGVRLGPPRSSPWDGIVGNEISQSDRYWKNLGDHQSTPSAGHNPVCPCPTAPPSGPKLSDRELAAVVIYAAEKNITLSHTAKACNLPTPSCDHTTCNPPLDVGFLSRRFEENGNWLRARAAAVAAQVHRRRGFYAVPIEILERITDYFPVIDPATDSATYEGPSRTWDRHTAFGVLASTSLRLRALYYHRSWGTTLVAADRLSALIDPPNEIKCPPPIHLIETLIVPLTESYAELLKQCLLALPSLRALGIMDHRSIVTEKIRNVFKNKPDFPNIKKVTVPVCAHPMLGRFPGVEEIVCYRCPSKETIHKSALCSARVSYARKMTGGMEPVLKSISVIGPIADGFTKVLVEKFWKIRKVSLPHPKEADMKALRGFKEIVELEFLLGDSPGLAARCHVDKVRQLSIEILQASECHEDCQCEYECGCTETGNCEDCNPPKRVLRIIKSRWANFEVPSQAVADAATTVEEILVSPLRILSTRIR